jgi:type I restriction enzyme M protein
VSRAGFRPHLTNKKAVEFHTPCSVVRLIVKMRDPRECESLYDPACGTGGMLLEAIHHVRECHDDGRTLGPTQSVMR